MAGSAVAAAGRRDAGLGLFDSVEKDLIYGADLEGRRVLQHGARLADEPEGVRTSALRADRVFFVILEDEILEAASAVLAFEIVQWHGGKTPHSGSVTKRYNGGR